MNALAQLAARADAIADAVVAETWSRQPELTDRYGPAGKVRCLEDVRYHLTYLHQALSVDEPAIFEAYALWGSSLLEQRAIPVDDLIRNLELLREMAGYQVPDLAERIAAVLDRSLQALRHRRPPPASFLVDGAPHVDLGRAYLTAVLHSQRARAVALIVDAAERGIPLRDLYLHVLQPVQHEVGRLWQINRINVAQEHLCTAVTQLTMSQLYPYLFAHPRCQPPRRVVATCVSGDLHELGVRMVADFFEMAGWDSTYLGANTPDAGVVERVRTERAEVVAISLTVPTQLDAVRRLIGALRADEIARQATILVGGRPFNHHPELAAAIGADGTARDAEAAVMVAMKLRAST